MADLIKKYRVSLIIAKLMRFISLDMKMMKKYLRGNYY